MQHLGQLFIFLVLLAFAINAQDKPEVLYKGNCGWAILNGYEYPAKAHIYIVRDKDTIRFYNQRTKNKWLKQEQLKSKEATKWTADKLWVDLQTTKQEN